MVSSWLIAYWQRFVRFVKAMYVLEEDEEVDDPMRCYWDGMGWGAKRKLKVK